MPCSVPTVLLINQQQKVSILTFCKNYKVLYNLQNTRYKTMKRPQIYFTLNVRNHLYLERLIFALTHLKQLNGHESMSVVKVLLFFGFGLRLHSGPGESKTPK